MNYIFIICLFIFFAYALGLVILNNGEVAVNLLFMQAPEMNLGLLLIICIFLGVLGGILLSLLMFKVVQNKWELGRLKKENSKLTHKLDKATKKVEEMKADATMDAVINKAVLNDDEPVVISDKS